MAVSTLIVVLFVVNCAIFTNGQQSEKFFRKDYTYLDSRDSFYKIHTVARTWREANKRCEMEGANLFYPEDENEASDVIAFWNKTQPFSWVFVGIHDLIYKDAFETVDGRPIGNVYNNWGPGEPNDAGGVEDCVVLRRDGILFDHHCDTKIAFICKKQLKDVQWNQACNFSNTDYIYNKTLDRCYKFHVDPKNWTEAMTICSAEQSYLAIINSQTEDDYLVKLIAENKNDTAPGLSLKGAVYLGFHNRLGEGWTTIQGQSLEESGFSWTPGTTQPDGGDSEQCGSMFYTGQLNDLGCSQRVFFICEHEIGRSAEDIDDRFNYLL